MPIKSRCAAGILALFWLAAPVLGNGMCPYDDQGPLGCPYGTEWRAELGVCLPPKPPLLG